MTENFTGAEIESLIESSMYEAFSDNKRDISNEDLIISIQNLVPISKLMKEEIDALRSWAIERARNASTIDFPSGNIDLDDEDL